MSDYIQILPTDDIPLTREEEFFLQPVLKSDTSLVTFVTDFQEILVYGLFFIILNLSVVDDFIKNTISYARQSHTSFILTKTFLFIILVFMYMNSHYVKKLK